MKKYISPKAEVINQEKQDIITASAGTDTTAAAAPVAPAAPVKSVVSPEALSEFWVTLEYVTPVENPVSVEENEEE